MSTPRSWDFLRSPNTLIKGSPNWIAASTDFRVWPIGKVFYFKSCFCSFCPKQGITLYISSTSYVSIKINGVWWLSIIPNWGGFHTLNIPASMLKCGCNNIIEFYAFNFGFPSPIAISWGFYQNCWSAMNCPNLGATFYNLDTCSCECAGTCNSPLVSYYPTCACMCPQSLFCTWPRYFNRRSCKC